MKRSLFNNYLVILLLLIVFVAFKWPYLSLPFFWDEGWPYNEAVQAMYNHGLSLKPDAISPVISRGHPLLFYCLAAGWMKLFGTSITVIHLFPLFLSVLLLVLVWLFCKNIFSESAGVTACFLLAVQPVFLAQSGLLLPEILVALLSTAGLFAFMSGSNRLYIVFAVLLLLTKESGVVLPVSAFIYKCIQFIFKNKDGSSFKSFLLESFLILSPLLVLMLHFILAKMIFGWYVYPEYAAFISWDIMAIFLKVQEIATYLFFYYGRFVYVLIALISLAIIYSGKKKGTHPNDKSFLLIIFCITYFLFSTLNMYSPRYYLTLVLILIVLFSDLLVRTFEGKKLMLYSTVGILFILSASFNVIKGSVHDHTLDYADGVMVNKDVVRFCESNNWFDKKIHARFLMMKSLTDASGGYLSSDRKFNFVYDGTPEYTEFYIRSSIENDNSYKTLKATRHLLLVKRFVRNNAWAEIYIPSK